MLRLSHTLIAVACLIGAVTTLLPRPAGALEDKYKVTNAEKAACTMDAMRLCSGSYPDEDKLLDCMRTNHAGLSSVCRVAFDAGVRRRHL